MKTNTDLQKVMEKIKKLLLKADSTDSPQEAEAFLVKANKLMIKFKIDQASINLNVEDGEIVLNNELKYGEFSLEGKWEIDLMRGIARNQACTYTWNSYRKTFTIYGAAEDVELTKYFFERARTIFRNLSRKAYNEKKKEVVGHLDSHPNSKELYESLGLNTVIKKVKWAERNGLISYRSVFVRSFLYGASQGLSQKLASMMRETIAEEENGKAYGLILTNQLERVDKWLSTNVKTKKVNQQGAFGDQDAMRKGREAGKNHNLTIGVDSTSTNQERNIKLN